MAKDETSKLRLLCVYNIINRGRLVTSTQILRELELRYDISADRKTIYSDIRAIDRIMPVESIPGKNGGYRKLDVVANCNKY